MRLLPTLLAALHCQEASDSNDLDYADYYYTGEYYWVNETTEATTTELPEIDIYALFEAGDGFRQFTGRDKYAPAKKPKKPVKRPVKKPVKKPKKKPTKDPYKTKAPRPSKAPRPTKDAYKTKQPKPDKDPYNPNPVKDPYNPKPVKDPYNPKPEKDPYNPKPVKDPYNPKPDKKPYGGGGYNGNKKPTILKKIPREKAPKQFAFEDKKPITDFTKFLWNADDAFYSKAFLRDLANAGVDTMGLNPIQGAIDDDAGLKAIVSGATKWSEIDPTDGKIIIPYSFHADFPWKDEVVAALEDMNNDLGCVKTMNIAESDISQFTAPFENGILIAFEDLTGGGCYSSIGVAPGFIGRAPDSGFNAIIDFGAPSGWQLMSLGTMGVSSCDGTDAGTIKHEFLHAMGFHHEHNRPDRTSFLEVNMGATEMDSQFTLMASSDWTQISNVAGGDRFPYETLSVMHYCSFCGASSNIPVMTYKDGSTFDSGTFMTTTDSLQAAWLYCNDRGDGYVEKEHIMCNSPDKFGFMRPVFTDRVCDNVKECFGGEDETNDENGLASCVPEDTLDSGCCKQYMLANEEFQQAGMIGGIDAFMSLTNTNSWLLRLPVAAGDTWFYTTTGLPDANTGQFQYNALSSVLGSSCPPTDGSFLSWDGFTKHVQCKFSGANFNSVDECATEQHNCHSDATCGDTISGFTCNCNAGFTGDGNMCAEIILVDECALELDNCSPEGGSCIDTQMGFECSCNSGTFDINGDGTNCLPQEPCCASFIIGIEDPSNAGTSLTNYQAICTASRVQENGWQDYSCIRNPGFGSQTWSPNDIVIQYGWVGGTAEWERYILFESSGGLLPEDNSAWPAYYGTQLLSQDLDRKCLVLDAWSTGPGQGFNMLANCLEFVTVVDDECATMESDCVIDSTCVNTDAGFHCLCESGFAGDGRESGLGCHPIRNECALELDDCVENAFCGDIDAGFTCTCSEGFEGDGHLNGIGCTQIDVDECTLETDQCDQNCENVANGFLCSCDAGWVLDTSTFGTCLDVDECVLGTDNCMVAEGNQAECVNELGSFSCMCIEGFQKVGDDQVNCHNVNECQSLDDACGDHSACTDLLGAFQCTCDLGFEVNSQGTGCGDMDECQNPLSCLIANENPSTCSNTFGSFTCECNDGFEQISESSPVCQDINECEVTENKCGDHSICTNTFGGFECSCDPGWSTAFDIFDVFIQCANVNECDLPENPCQTNSNQADCVDNDGGFICFCMDGYAAEPGIDQANVCMNVNECDESSTCDRDAGNPVSCVDNVGSFECICDDGFTIDSNGLCTDNDECGEDPCGINSGNQASCTNEEGGFTCACLEGYEEFQTMVRSFQCININECARGDPCKRNSGSKVDCADTDGSYTCTCHEGHVLNLGNGLCEDVNECADINACMEHSSCVNTAGGHVCNCNWGFMKNGDICLDMNECNNDPCMVGAGNPAACENTMGSFSCNCNEGYGPSGIGYQCTDVDECLIDNDICGPNSFCTNTESSFDCGCNTGYDHFTDANGFSQCININECMSPLGGPCEVGGNEADCTDTIGGFTCICRAGYQGMIGDSQLNQCFDVNECFEDPCQISSASNPAECINFPGGFECKCLDGYLDFQGVCVDIDECQEDPCSIETDANEATCTNTDGSFECICNAGYAFFDDSLMCMNVDECQADPCMTDIGNPADCEDTEGSFVCNCRSGFETNGIDGSTLCVNTNECLTETDNCNTHATCVDTFGSFTCHCKFGFTGDGVDCHDMDECAVSDPCFILEENEAACENTMGSYQCACLDGFRKQPDSDIMCQDIDECIETQDLCGDHSTCTNTHGSFECGCVNGWELFVGKLGGIKCHDIDECASNINPCQLDGNMASCENNDGGYTCTCDAGYDGNVGISFINVCLDIDECAGDTDPCAITRESNPATCNNIAGSYECICLDGFSMDSVGMCSDENECDADPCGITAGNPVDCVNSIGAFACECQAGYSMNPEVEFQCDNINECALTATCGISTGNQAECEDTDGSFVCTCFPGYSMAMDGSCVDNNECAAVDDAPCPTDSTCVNKPGSFICPCNWGFVADGDICVDLNECSMGDPCQANTGNPAECVNTHGSFECSCLTGYRQSAENQFCIDVDECIENPNICGDHSTCTNLEGNFKCTCHAGYELDFATDGGAGCINIDECAADQNPCTVDGNMAECMDTDGGFTCTCLAGYEGLVRINELNECHDINECFVSDPCNMLTGNQASCVNQPGTFECFCNEGFTMNGAGVCQDNDECLDDPCEATEGNNAACRNFPGGFECSCNVGYEFDTTDQKTCININECDTPATCDIEFGNPATCEDTEGSYQCFCGEGFIIDVTATCNDINECLFVEHHLRELAGMSQYTNLLRGHRATTVCTANSDCINTPGSFHCECKEGYATEQQIIGDVCVDFDECAANMCGANMDCTNSEASFSCECASGFTEDPAGTGACLDIDECPAETRMSVCGDFSTCFNIDGSFVCGCMVGYVMTDGVCTNIDECADVEDPCDIQNSNAFCVDIEGGFQCICDSGFTGASGMNEATDCTDVDECAENTDDCGNDACVNTEGGFTCSAATTTVATTTTWPEGCTCTQFTCMCTTTTVTPDTTTTPSTSCASVVCDAGFECAMSNGVAGCVDIDECTTGVAQCDELEICVNSEGSFECAFDESKCSSINLDIDWKGAKYVFPQFVGDRTTKLMAVVFNDHDSIDIRNEAYTGYLMWGKIDCGMDMVQAVADGRLSFEIMDYGAYYSIDTAPYFRSDKTLSGGILEIKQNIAGTVPDMPHEKKTGNAQKKDQFEIVIRGLETVSFPSSKDPAECLKSASVGVYISHDTSVNASQESVVKCAAWGRNIFNRIED